MTTTISRSRLAASAVVVAATVALAGCGSTASTSATSSTAGTGSPAQAAGSSGGSLKGASFTVGGKEFTEQENLCYLTIDVLQAHGANVTQKCGLNGSSTARQALTSGSIDMYWEYTGTAWTGYLHQTKKISDPATLYQDVAKQDLAQNHIKWLKPASFTDTYAIIVKKSTANKLNVHTLSQYAALIKKDPSQAKTCLASEFASRPDGWPGLEKAYGFSLPSSDIVSLAEGSIFNAVSKGSPCTFGESDSSTDGRIASLQLMPLTDDKHFFPPYNPSLCVRQSVYSKYPQLAKIFAKVTAKLTYQQMLQMNTDVDVKGQQAQDVAKKWLQTNNLI